jgi:tetratricopeptide (TPR) repeat protein
MALSSRANVMTTIGQFAQAIEQFKASDAIATSISYGFGHFACLNNISYAACMDGDFALAKSAALGALETANLLEAPSARAHALVSLGIAERQLGDNGAAIVHLEEGTSLERELNERIALAEDLCELIIALLRGGVIERATVLVEELLVLAGDPGHKLSHPQLVHWTAALVYRAQGNSREAKASLDRARQLLDELESTIPDPDSRKTFRMLRYNQAIDIAFDCDRWSL